MKLEVEVRAFKKSGNSVIDKISIVLRDYLIIAYYPPHPLSYSKFRRTEERVIRKLNSGDGQVILESSENYYYSSPLALTTILYMDSSNLHKIRLSKDQRDTIERVIRERSRKVRVYNPSKPTSQMELRKRMWKYGK